MRVCVGAVAVHATFLDRKGDREKGPREGEQSREERSKFRYSCVKICSTPKSSVRYDQPLMVSTYRLWLLPRWFQEPELSGGGAYTRSIQPS